MFEVRDRMAERERKKLRLLAVEVDARLLRLVEQVARYNKQNKSEIVREALRDYLRTHAVIGKKPATEKVEQNGS